MLRRHFIINVNSDIPNNEIWYTEKYGKIVEPNDASSLPTIVSNTYSKGKGIIKFASDVTSIGNLAFFGCSSLTSITIPNSVKSIGDYVLNYCFSLTSINVNANNSKYSSVDGVLFDKDKTTLITYPGGKQGAYTIPNSVKSIENWAFEGCSSLTSITIPNSVTSIGEEAFHGCDNITSVTWNAKNCNSYNFSSQVTSFEFGNEVEVVPSSLCEGMEKLTSISIPNSVTSIGEEAFYDCSSLTSISYTGTIAQWRTIYKGDSWNRNVPATIVHCTDGDVAI